VSHADLNCPEAPIWAVQREPGPDLEPTRSELRKDLEVERTPRALHAPDVVQRGIQQVVGLDRGAVAPLAEQHGREGDAEALARSDGVKV
jgi:hypothetical protein